MADDPVVAYEAGVAGCHGAPQRECCVRAGLAAVIALVEAPDSPLCDCENRDEPPTNPTTGQPMDHHCDCAAVAAAGVLLGSARRTRHVAQCGCGGGAPAPTPTPGHITALAITTAGAAIITADPDDDPDWPSHVAEAHETIRREIVSYVPLLSARIAERAVRALHDAGMLRPGHGGCAPTEGWGAMVRHGVSEAGPSQADTTTHPSWSAPAASKPPPATPPSHAADHPHTQPTTRS